MENKTKRGKFIKVRFVGCEPEILEGYTSGDYKKRYYYRWTGQEIEVKWDTLTPDGYIMVEIVEEEQCK